MSVNLSFIGGAGWQFFDNSGNPLSGGKVYTYAAGSTTPQITYTNRTGTIPNTNPIILDSAGRTPAQIWSTEGILYKYVVKTSTEIELRSWDNIGGSVVASNLAQDLAAFSGSSMIGYMPAGIGAIASTVQTKLRESVSVLDFGAVGNGITDDTAAIQAALNSGAKKIIAPAGLTFLTSNTLFVTSNNTLVDFNQSTIKNVSNSMYAICLVTANIGSNTEAALRIVLANLNYGNEIKNSCIQNLVVSMSPTTTGGNNLGVGIVYGKNCNLFNITIEQSNGNGIEVRNSTQCNVEKSYVTCRSYGAFFFMTKNCTLTDTYITSCVRGIVTKMSQAGAPVNFNAARCTVENLSDGFYYTVGGEYKERALTDPIYQAGHENVLDVTYENCIFQSTINQVKVTLGYWASRFNYIGCTFQSTVYSAGAFIGSDGNSFPGDVQGKDHKFVGCSFVNSAGTVANSAISTSADTLISDCVFTGSYQRLLISDQTYTSNILFSNNFIQANLQTISDSANSLFVGGANSTLTITNNIIIMTLVFSNFGSDSASNIAINPYIFSGNTIRITGASNYSHNTLSTDSGIAHNNNLYYKNFGGTVYPIYVTGAADIQSNVIKNNGTVGASSIALYLVSNSIAVSANNLNSISGTWSYKEFANLSQNYSYYKRVKLDSVIPLNGTWEIGDRVFNNVPAIGQPKSWVCTVSGTPGTWVSEGNL